MEAWNDTPDQALTPASRAATSAAAGIGRQLIEELRGRRRAAAPAWLGQQTEAEQAAQAATASPPRKQFLRDIPETVREAASAARRRVTELGSGDLLAELRILLSLGPAPAEHTHWTALLPTLGDRPLPDDLPGETADASAAPRSAGARELVSA